MSPTSYQQSKLELMQKKDPTLRIGVIQSNGHVVVKSDRANGYVTIRGGGTIETDTRNYDKYALGYSQALEDVTKLRPMIPEWEGELHNVAS